MFKGIGKLIGIKEKISGKGNQYHLLEFAYFGGSMMLAYFDNVQSLTTDKDYELTLKISGFNNISLLDIKEVK